jgi:hypothetical protein
MPDAKRSSHEPDGALGRAPDGADDREQRDAQTTRVRTVRRMPGPTAGPAALLRGMFDSIGGLHRMYIYRRINPVCDVPAGRWPPASVRPKRAGSDGYRASPRSVWIRETPSTRSSSPSA